MKAVMVEHTNEYGEWVWWGVFINTTPRKALKHYALEVGLSAKVRKAEPVEESDALYLDDHVKAYEIELIDNNGEKQKGEKVNVECPNCGKWSATNDPCPHCGYNAYF